MLRRELGRPSWQRETVSIGAATDPYQPAEGRFRLTRACLVELSQARTPFSIITRGPLVVRDIDVLQEASERAEVGVYFSIPTLDERVWRTTEPGTAPPRSRLEAVRRLADAGIDVGVGMAPILPGLSDRPEQLEEVVREARAAGARSIWANVLYLRPGTREHFLAALAEDWPEEVERYEQLYARPRLPPVGDREVDHGAGEEGEGVRSLASPQAGRPAGAAATRSRRLGAWSGIDAPPGAVTTKQATHSHAVQAS